MPDLPRLFPDTPQRGLRVLIGCETSGIARHAFAARGHDAENALLSLSCSVHLSGPAGVCTAISGPNRNGSSEDRVMADEALSSYQDESQFRSIAGFPRYLVSRDGFVYSARLIRGKVVRYHRMASCRCQKGYARVVLCNHLGHFNFSVHRLVAQAFIENTDGLPCVRHMDGNPRNNSAGNLAWGTYADNEEDKRAHGTWDSRRTGKLSTSDRQIIREMHAAGWAQKDIAVRFHVSRSTITRLVNGSIWGNDSIACPPARNAPACAAAAACR